MIAKPKGWNILLAGFWNRMIFIPEWVSPRLFPGPEIDTQVAMLPVLPLIYSDQQVELEVSSMRLVFRPLHLWDDAVCHRAEEMARRVLIDLPETPVHAVGINFGFREDLPPDHLRAIFDNFDDLELEQQEWTIGERLARRLSWGNDVLNLVMTCSGNAIDFDCNFHSEAGSNDAARAAMNEGRFLALRDTAIAILRDVYHLELEDTNGNGDGPQ